MSTFKASCVSKHNCKRNSHGYKSLILLFFIFYGWLFIFAFRVAFSLSGNIAGTN